MERSFNSMKEFVEAIKTNDFKKLEKLLIENGADVNKANNVGNTSLYIAAQFGYLEVVKLLIENGADMNQANRNALYRAVYKGHLEVIKLLIENGADVNKATRYGYTP